MIEEARRALGSTQRLLMVAPTGSGKTVLAAYKARRFLERENRRGVVVYAVHRRQLVEQTARVFERYGIPCTIVMAGYQTDFSKEVYVMSRQTWEMRRKHLGLGNVELLLIDEAHIGVEGQKRLIDDIQPRFTIGYTATPITLRGPGMGAVYERLVQGPSYMELIEAGHLVPTRWLVAKPLDDSGLRVSRATNEYVHEDVVQLVKGQVLADFYDAYMEHGGRHNVIFAPSVDIAATIAARLGSYRIRAAAIDWSTPARVRQRILEEFRQGTIEALVNVDVFSEGWDEPVVDTIFLASPTRSLARHIQRIGRGMRPHRGKLFVRIVDLVGAMYRHGTPEDIEGWELEEQRPDRKRTQGEGVVKRRGICPRCGTEMQGASCPCGFVPQYRYEEAELEVVGPAVLEEQTARMVWLPQDKRGFYLQLLHYAREHRKKDGWAAHMYKERFGEWPAWEWKGMETIPPTPDVKRYIISKWIRWGQRQPRKIPLWNINTS